MSAGDEARARARFRGTVQGVGFRYTTRNTASGFAVTGFVRNEPDGSVTVVAEGMREEVEGFLAAVQRRMGGYIRDADVEWERATGEFDDFGVAFSW